EIPVGGCILRKRPFERKKLQYALRHRLLQQRARYDSSRTCSQARPWIGAGSDLLQPVDRCFMRRMVRKWSPQIRLIDLAGA
ncbi:MAG TPA: hypothetical protein VGN34_10795, partial [Ktedonobacteraceae bacterium]